jgi:hypothetical protein
VLLRHVYSRLDMGTSDELALDVLINALSVFSREQLGVRQLVVGGQNEDWPTPQVQGCSRCCRCCCCCGHRCRRRLACLALAGIPELVSSLVAGIGVAK